MSLSYVERKTDIGKYWHKAEYTQNKTKIYNPIDW